MKSHVEVALLNPAQLLLTLPDGKLVLCSVQTLTVYPFKLAYCVEELPTGWLSTGPDWATASVKLNETMLRFVQDSEEAKRIADSLLPFLNLLYPVEGKHVTRWDLR